MAKFKMKQLALAMGLALGGMALVPSAQAVHLATDNQGQALVIPYYTVRDGWKTLINLTNTSNHVLAVKIRLNESYNTRDILDFNVIMSPYDVWSATVTNSDAGGVLLTTADSTCTAPNIPSSGVTSIGGLAAYTGAASDGGPDTVDRMREGHISVILMGSSAPPYTTFAKQAIHVQTGQGNNTGTPPPIGPDNLPCKGLEALFNIGTPAGLQDVQASFPDYASNPLKGIFSLVHAENGLNATGEAVALADFRTTPYVTLQVQPGRLEQGGFAPAAAFQNSYHEPSLASANTPGEVLDDLTGAPVKTTAPGIMGGASAISFVLQRATVDNQWANRPPQANDWVVNSDWVVTFPTKRFHVDNYAYEYAGRAQYRMGLPAGKAPFASDFVDGYSCDIVSWLPYDREEYSRMPTDPGSPPVFSPAPVPPEQDPNSLCRESNVLTFDGSNVLKASGPYNVTDLPGQNGWMRLTLTNNPLMYYPGPSGYAGLPAVSFAVLTRSNTAESGVLNEAYTVDAAYTRRYWELIPQ